jgi:hypothetical protein
MKNPNPTLKHGPAVAFATKSNGCCAAMWRTINGLMKNPNPTLKHGPAVAFATNLTVVVLPCGAL